MCSICGFINYGSEGRSVLLKGMVDALAHRGPDGNGEYLNDSVGLGHCRLAIIDLDTGEQPMTSWDGRFVTIFNGEIYNYRELRDSLVQAGSEFRTSSDTEVIAESIRHWGIEKASKAFRGMFAFAVYDTHEKVVYLSRDRTGIKPLYWTQQGDAIFFASEQKALLRIPKISKKLNHVAIHDYLTLGFPLTPDTCWEAIQLFPPAHYAVIKTSTPQVEPIRYWSWEQVSQPISFADALDQAGSILQESLRYHLRSDVPLAAFLSGGIDSSLLVRFLSDGLVENLKTFNVGFSDEKYDESPDARFVADTCKTDHHEIRMESGQGNPQLFETIISQYDEPFGDSSCLPTYMISKEMRRHVKVVISGDGGDELFGGYSRFNHILQLQKLRYVPCKSMAKALTRGLSPVFGADFVRRFGQAMDAVKGDVDAMYCALHTYYSETDKSDVYVPEFRERLKSRDATWQRYRAFLPQHDDCRDTLMGAELAINLHADYLRKVDIASSAHGLEVRVPFLDSEVLEFAGRLPIELKLRSGTLKYLLRELARRELGDRIADKGKWGFGIPFDSWCGPNMRTYLKDLLLGGNQGEGMSQVVSRQSTEKLWQMFEHADESNYADISRYQIYQRVFMLASLQIWFRKLGATCG